MDPIVLLSLIAGTALLVYLLVRHIAPQLFHLGSPNQDATTPESELAGLELSSQILAPSAPRKSYAAKTASKKATSSSGSAKAAGTSGSQQKTGKAAKAPQSKQTPARPKGKAPSGTATAPGGAGVKSRRSARTGSRTS